MAPFYRTFLRIYARLYSVQLLKPDRFTKFDSPIEMQNPNVTKMLLLNRVSLLSFKRNQAEFAQQGPYSKEHCQLLAQDENIDSPG